MSCKNCEFYSKCPMPFKEGYFDTDICAENMSLMEYQEQEEPGEEN